ncbi:MAG TPA: aspartyl protease family protein [Rhizomicrobium sp.]|nr:aspartyl protease family protein [Rhizomicrobium sp.]
MSGRLSRRALLGCGAAAWTFPAAAVTGETAIVENAANLLTIGVSVAGQGPYRFVVDTGADRTVIAQEVAEALSLPRGDKAAVAGIARTVVADTVHAGRLRLGAMETEELNTPVLPRAWLGADGYLGLDVIDGHRVIFDFRNRVMAFGGAPSSYFFDYVKADETVLRGSGSGGHLRSVDCRVDGVHATTFLDTGAEVSVGNSKLFEALSRAGNGFLPTAPVMLSGVTGGSVAGRALAIERAQLGGFDLSTSGLVIADLPIFELWNLADKPALFIGMDFLNHFSKVTIDYGRKQYRLELASLMLASRT